MVTLTELELTNYRCFEHHRIPLRENTVVVGSNNAGKSTVVEALKLLSLVSERYKSANYSLAPRDLGIPDGERGITPSLDGIDFVEASLCYHYGLPPAKVVGRFSNGAAINIYLSADRFMFATVEHPEGGVIANKAAARRVGIPLIRVLDNIGPLAAEETVLSDTHVRKSAATRLAPLHFRNHLVRAEPDVYRRFRTLVSEWRGLDVQPVEREFTNDGTFLSVDVREAGFTAEASWMGQGVQAWLQTAWHIAKSDQRDIVVLDEPDVYMHADMQRRVAKLLQGRFAQTIVATHSVEIVAEAQPQDVLVVNKNSAQSTYASGTPEVQALVDRIGTRYNIQIARLVGARRCLLVEGGDLRVLSAAYDVCHPESEFPLDIIPSWPIGGWSGWDSAVSWASSFRQHQAGTRVYCLMDRDHHTDDEIRTRYEQAAAAGVDLHIWKRKELESYLLVATLVSRTLRRELEGSGIAAPSAREIEQELESLTNDMRDRTMDLVAEGYGRKNPRFGAARVNAYAREVVAANWDSLEHRLSIVHGKELLRALLDWCASNYRGIGERHLLVALAREDVPTEMRGVFSAIDGARALARPR